MLLLTAGLTGAASFLNALFWELDFAILSFYHSVSEAVGVVLSPIMYVISLQSHDKAPRPAPEALRLRHGERQALVGEPGQVDGR